MILQALEYEAGRFFFLDDICACIVTPVSYLNLFVIFVAEHGKVLDEFFLSTAGRNSFQANTDKENENICFSCSFF